MLRSSRDERDVACFERLHVFPVELKFPGALDHIHGLFAVMRVHGQSYARVDFDAHLNYLATRNAEIMSLQLGTLDSLLLRRRELQCQRAHDGEQRYRDPASRSVGHHCQPALRMTRKGPHPRQLNLVFTMGVQSIGVSTDEGSITTSEPASL